MTSLSLKPMHIGGVVVDPPVVLAPMAGLTDVAFRTMCRNFGSGMTLTEVVTAAGLVHGSRRTLHMLETGVGEHPIAGHIYGSDPSVMAAAAATIEALGRFDFVDINCGCPVRRIVARGAGVALMRDPAKLGAIVRSVVSAVGLPVTLKTRLGICPDLMNISEVAQAAEEGGASAIIVHARFASNQHRGQADWEALARIKAERGIPVIGNGSVDRPEDAFRLLAETSVDGVMIGRAAIGNPWIFRQITDLARTGGFREPGNGERRRVILEHLARLTALKDKEMLFRRRTDRTAEQAAVLVFRPHLVRYLNGYRRWCEVRRRMNDMLNLTDVLDALDTVMVDEMPTDAY